MGAEATQGWVAEARTSYDTVASSYAEQVGAALADQPFLRGALSMFAESALRFGAPVADIGCGPGHVTAHLHELGLEAFGIDVSPRMIEVALRDHPGLRFEVGSMTELDLPAQSLGGLIAWQSLIHIPDEDVPAVLRRFRHFLCSDAPLQLLFHVGDDSWVKTEGYGGHPMHVRVYRRQPEQVTEWLRKAGFEVQGVGKVR